MARKFLYIMAALITLVIAGGFVMRIYEKDLTDLLITQIEPTTKFKKQTALQTSIYSDPAMWFSKSGSIKDNPTQWVPDGAPKPDYKGSAAIFFIHPTSYIGRDYWNAPITDADSQNRAKLFLRGLASPFASVGDVWAPRYRQAAIGAFLTTKPEGKAALDVAYQDVLLAFDNFVAAQQKDRPIILAGHSQGALHLTHLLKERIAGKPLAKRIVAAYVVGWPISVEADLEELGLPACNGPSATRCIMSWQSFAEPADYGNIVAAYDKTIGFNGERRAGTHILCTNPLNGGATGDVGAEGNLGTLKPSDDLSSGVLVPKAVPARCDEKGFLLIGDPPNLGPYRLPGNNYHVYDFPLFWGNVRADAMGRLRQYLAR